MSIEYISNIFSNLTSISNLSIQLLKMEHNSIMGSRYSTREISINEQDRFTLLFEISQLYTTGKKSISYIYTTIKDYDGTTDGMTIYRMNKDNPLIATQYNGFLSAISDPELEEWPFNYNSAYLIKGNITLGNDEHRVILASIANPVTTLKRKYSWVDNNLRSISEKVINLRNTFDMITIDDTVYFLTMAAENLFHMERSYKQVCAQAVDEILQTELFSDADTFKTVATSNHNPRRFVSYDKRNFDYLKVRENRKSIAEKFGIALTGTEDVFDTDSEENCTKIVKILCDKGMVHPINNNPVEVNGTKPWT